MWIIIGNSTHAPFPKRLRASDALLSVLVIVIVLDSSLVLLVLDLHFLLRLLAIFCWVSLFVCSTLQFFFRRSRLLRCLAPFSCSLLLYESLPALLAVSLFVSSGINGG